MKNEPSAQSQPLPTNEPPSNPGRSTAPRLASAQRLGRLATRKSGAPEDAILADWLSPDRLATDPLSQSGPLFLVYLSAHCPLCQKLSADLVGLIAGFGDRVTIELVLQGNAEEFSELVQSIARLGGGQGPQQPQQNSAPSNYSRYRLAYDEAGVLREVLTAEGVPFALMVSPSDHVAETVTAAAPIAYGPDRIRLSFALLLNALA